MDSLLGLGSCHGWVHAISDVLIYVKTYHGKCGTISGKYHGRCCHDNLPGQHMLNDLRSCRAGLEPFIVSMIQWQYSFDAAGIL